MIGSNGSGPSAPGGAGPAITPTAPTSAGALAGEAAGASPQPGLRYAYYTGCVPKQSSRELDVATRLVESAAIPPRTRFRRDGWPRRANVTCRWTALLAAVQMRRATTLAPNSPSVPARRKKRAR